MSGNNALAEDASVVNIQPFHIISSAEHMILEALMTETAGLRRDQFAMNSWGFPPIPIPEPRYVSNRSAVRCAPVNVSDEFLGHPIFWIEPSLTAFDRDTESEEQWSIRMFYLIAGFGYWTEDTKWVNFLLVQGFDNDPGDIHAYRTMANTRCKMDEYKLLSEEDLNEDVYNSYISALERCNEEFRHELEEFINSQTVALSSAKRIIGPNSRSNTLTADDPEGLWSSSIAPGILRISAEYDQRLSRTSNAPIADLTDDAINEFTRVKDILIGINRVIALLSIPIISNSETGSKALSEMSTYMILSTRQASQRNDQYNFAERVSEALSVNRGVGNIHSVIEDVYNIYRSRWRQVRLVLANYERQQAGLPIFQNYTELERELITMNDADLRSTRSADVLGDIDRLLGN